jgi:hypothetical protein
MNKAKEYTINIGSVPQFYFPRRIAQRKKPIFMQSLTAKILETYPGIVQGSRPAFLDLCISEIHFFGHAEGGNN